MRSSSTLENKLSYFVAAYEAPNFATAAKNIPISVQGLVQSIHRLEQEFDVPLFFQDEAGLRHPTAFAKEIYDYAKRVEKERRALDNSLKRLMNPERIEVDIASSLGILGVLGFDFEDQLRKELPNVALNMFEVPDYECEQMLRSREYDLGFIVCPPSDESFRYEPFASTNVCFWVNESNPLSKKDLLTLEDLSTQAIALPGENFRIYHQLQQQFDAAGLEQPTLDPYMELFWIHEYVLDDRGIGFTLPLIADLETFSHPNVVAIPTELPWICGAACIENHQLSENEKLVISVAKDIAKRRMR